MEGQLAHVLSKMMDTMTNLQEQQNKLQQSLSNQGNTSTSTVSGITLQPYDEINESFDSYLQRLQNYITLKGVTNATTKLHIFLNCIGPKHYQVLKNLTAPNTPESKTYEDLVQILRNHIAPEPGEVAQQHKFCLRIQQEQESIANYVAGLKEIGGKCNFVCNGCKISTFETHLRVQFIRGLRNAEIKERLLQEPSTAKVEEIIKIAMAIETSKSESKEMGNYENSQVNKMTVKKDTYYKNTFKKNTFRNNTKEERKINCYRCGKQDHKAYECKIKDKLYCQNCHTKGHVKSVCFKEQRQLDMDDESSSDECENEEALFEIHTVNTNTQNDKFNITLQINGTFHTWELDTGAAVTTCSADYYYKHFQSLKLQDTKIKLRTYTGEIIQPLGTCNMTIKFKNKLIHDRLIVIDRKVDPVVGREWIRKLNIHFEVNKIINTEESKDITEQEFKQELQKLLKDYEDLFSEEIGEINNYKTSFKLKESTTPVFLKPRPVPFALREQVEKEIDRLEEAGIFEKITYSQWGTPIVPVIKPTGKVRLCADYRATLNKNLENDNYPIPRVEEIFSKLSGGKYFCTLDINQAYLHMTTDEASAEMQAVSTCKGTYKVNRLMFGVKIAPNIWQRYMDQTLQGVPGTACFFDDIALQGRTYTELLERLKTVFKKLKECGLHLNKKKCQFFQNSITYLGHKINEEGLHPTEEKINEIKNSHRPTDVSSLRTFLGMVNYYQQFIPNLASKLNPLYKLLQKNTKFVWTKECENAFQNLRKEICGDKVLTPFHASLPVTLATDASPIGFGAVLSHIMPDKTERPIAFASRSLTAAEKNYTQLDKEAAALIWGLKKFFQFCYGRKIILIIDNQPLARILHPTKLIPSTTAIRLVHYANFLAGFDYELRLRKTSEHANADYFSRLEHSTTENKENRTDDDMFYLNQIAMMPITMKKIKEATAKDPELQELFKNLQSGTGNMNNLHEFSIQDGCIFYGIRIVIPKSLQPTILQELHTAHTGIVKMKALARSYVWWKYIDSDIEKMVKGCKACCLLQRNPTKVPVHSWEYPKEPWSRIHIDYAGPFMNTYFLVVVDAYTKWLEVIPTTSITATATISILKKLFTTFGLPIMVVSDNGRQFRSEEMQNFLKENGIQSRFTAPFHPSTNGQAERYVQTFKNKLKAMMYEQGTLQDKLSKLLMMYRKTPNNSTGLSPAEMMFKRLYRTRIDLVKRDITTEMNNKKEDIVINKEFNVGETVQIRSYDNNKWKFGVVVGRKGKLHYEIDIDGKIQERHADQIIKSSVKDKECTFYNDQPVMRHHLRETNSPTRPESTEGENVTPPSTTEPILQERSPTPEPVYREPAMTPESGQGETTPRTSIETQYPEGMVRRSKRVRKPPNRLDL